MTLITRQQLCTELSVSDSTVARWLRAGLPHTPIGLRGKRFDAAEVRTWLRLQSLAPTPGDQGKKCQPGQTHADASTSALWQAANVFTASCRRAQLRVMPS